MKKIIAVVCAVLMLVCLTACGGSDAEYTVGICQADSGEKTEAATEGFMQAVKDELGDDAVAFDLEVGSNDPDSCSGIADSFVADGVDLILANGVPALQAAAAATSEIPILGTGVANYGTALGTEGSIDVIGGNISGSSILMYSLDQAVMVLEWFPDATRIGMFYCADDSAARNQAESLAVFLEDSFVECEFFEFQDADDLAQTVQAACDFADVIFIPDDSAAASDTAVIDEICRAAGDPVITGNKDICADCGVAAMCIDYYDLGYAAGKMAARILKGEEDISQMPIEYMVHTESWYNAERCTELGLTPPFGYDPITE